MESGTVAADPGRRARKKAVTRQLIADTALELFLARGFNAVGIRDVAERADVAGTTVFAHFASKEALVFAHAGDLEHDLRVAVEGRADGEPLVPALRQAIGALVAHCTQGDAVQVWRMIEATPALVDHARLLEARYAAVLLDALTSAPDVEGSAVELRALSHFVISTFAIAREDDHPAEALDEMFAMIDAAWGRVSG